MKNLYRAHKPNSTVSGYISSNIRPTYQGSDKSSRRISLIWPLDTGSRDKTLSGFQGRGPDGQNPNQRGANPFSKRFRWILVEGGTLRHYSNAPLKQGPTKFAVFIQNFFYLFCCKKGLQNFFQNAVLGFTFPSLRTLFNIHANF